MSSLKQGYHQANKKVSQVEKIIDRELLKDQNCELDEISFFIVILD